MAYNFLLSTLQLTRLRLVIPTQNPSCIVKDDYGGKRTAAMTELWCDEGDINTNDPGIDYFSPDIL